jgi:hypothetical protein
MADRASPAPRRRAQDVPGAAPAVPWLKRPLRWLQEQLRRPLRLERRGLNIHVTLAPPASMLTETEVGTSGVVGSGEALRLSHLSLRRLLDQHPKTRRTMRHLAYLERALSRHGSRAIRQEIPVPVLIKCREQLDLLAPQAASDPFAELRMQLRDAIGSRPHDPHGFALSQPVHVSEASHSQFDALERSWTGAVPPTRPPKP